LHALACALGYARTTQLLLRPLLPLHALLLVHGCPVAAVRRCAALCGAFVNVHVAIGRERRRVPRARGDLHRSHRRAEQPHRLAHDRRRRYRRA
jgi:hypothetical protein